MKKTAWMMAALVAVVLCLSGCKEETAMKRNQTIDDISLITFYVNSGTGTEWVYYDLEEGCRYRGSDSYPFSDLSEEKKQDCLYGDELARQLSAAGVTEWESVSEMEGIDDAQSMQLEIHYGSGTVFTVTAQGILGEIMPDSYPEVESILLDGME